MFSQSEILYQTRQIRALEEIAIKKYKITQKELMQRAGKAAFAALRKHWPRAKKIAVVCGKGNNGGDGFVLAYLAHKAGMQISIFYLFPPKNLDGAAKKAALQCKKAGIKLVPFIAEKLAGFHVLVDAIFGIGLSGKVRSEYRHVIVAINASKLPILSIDIPSGLDANTGNILGDAIHADLTITFIGLKQGLFTSAAPEYCGKILCSNLGLPQEAFVKQSYSAKILDITALLPRSLPPRSKIAHKGDFGHALIIGGDHGMAGAARMAAEAAARVGAGLTSVATRSENISIINSNRPELMVHGANNIACLATLITRANAIIIGPGIGHSAWSCDLLQNILSVKKPLVVDADALNYLAENLMQRQDWILTPHPGEAARLLRSTTTLVQADRFKAVRSLQEIYGGVCVLKGAGTLICHGEDIIDICTAGNPGMASGGMGDILSGVIGGLLAQGLTIKEAANLGVILHAMAGDMAAKEYGERGLLATDLLPHLRLLINSQQGYLPPRI